MFMLPPTSQGPPPASPPLLATSTLATGHPAPNPERPRCCLAAEPRLHADAGDNRVRLWETDYMLYATFHLHSVRNGTQTRVLALYGTPPATLP